MDTCERRGGHITLATTTESQAFANGKFFIESAGLPDNSYHLKFVIMLSPAFHRFHVLTNLLTSRMTTDTARLQLAGAPSGDLSFAPVDRERNVVRFVLSRNSSADN